MKKIISLVLALTMSLSLAACGGTSGESSGSTGTADSGSSAPAGGGSGYSVDSLEVNIWDSNQLDGIQKIADEWTEKSGVKVKVNVITWNEYWTLLEAGASGGELPDVFWMHINEAQKYMEGDVLLNLDDYIAADQSTDLSNYYEGIITAVQAAVRGGMTTH